MIWLGCSIYHLLILSIYSLIHIGKSNYGAFEFLFLIHLVNLVVVVSHLIHRVKPSLEEYWSLDYHLSLSYLYARALLNPTQLTDILVEMLGNFSLLWSTRSPLVYTYQCSTDLSWLHIIYYFILRAFNPSKLLGNRLLSNS